MAIKHESISFSHIQDLPGIDLLFTACRIGPDGYLFDTIDFTAKNIERWSMPFKRIPMVIEKLEKNIPSEFIPFGLSHKAYYDNYLMSLHTAQLSTQKSLFVCIGDFYNGFYVPVIDTRSDQVNIFPDNFEDPLMQYSCTGDFTPDNKHWMFIRWPFQDSLDILSGKRELARCEIGRVLMSDLSSEIIYKLDNIDRIHQITCSPDGRHVVFSPFRWEMNLPYPDSPMTEDLEGYRKSHESGMKTDELITVDLKLNRHWRTKIPVPVTAHFEFDPFDPSVFYLSSHHFHPIDGNVILEGSACLFKMRIRNGETVIDEQYSDDQFFRMSQHVPFEYEGRVLVAVTNFPNKLDLIDAGSMTLWRRIELFPAEPVDCSKTGNVICPVYPESCFSINPSRDGKYIVLESPGNFSVYSLDEDRLLTVRIPKYLPDGFRGIGHTRLAYE